MNDSVTTIQELKDILLKFKQERDWGQFHDPKNLAEAISIEAGELQELFLWQDTKEGLQRIHNDKIFKERVGEELADIITFCLNFANATQIDVTKIVIDKISKNSKKYPISKSKGISDKYTEL